MQTSREARKATRFWRASRTIPMLMLIAALVVVLLPLARPYVSPSLMRQFFYPVKHAEYIEESAERHGVDPYLVCAVIRSESSWDEYALSSAGAVGLMQILPSTAQEMADMGLVDPWTNNSAELNAAHVNIEYGSAYLAYLQRHFGSLEKTIAAYNAGMGVVSRWSTQNSSSFEDAIEYSETRNYLERVKESYGEYQRLYPDGIGAYE
ncbi:MAG: lytic transglycosylase domain-containing protein [Atopobiaceae bacterium]|nr:lytic transglycosylase domain-containing protein [Atopobiaceae bacterium]